MRIVKYVEIHFDDDEYHYLDNEARSFLLRVAETHDYYYTKFTLTHNNYEKFVNLFQEQLVEK